MKQSTTFLMISLVFTLSFVCCCCGGLGGDFSSEQFQELLAGNLDTIMEEAAEIDVEEIIGTPTPEESPSDVDEDAAESESSSDEAVAEAPAEAEAEAPAVEETEEESVEEPAEIIPEIPGIEDLEGNEEELALEILEALEEQLEEGGDEPFSFGCDDPNIPMPTDVEGCVSVAGFTTYSTAVSEAEINQLYDDYFLGQGWEHFPPAIQEDVLNAWQQKGTQGYAFVAFTPGGGENGKNMINLAIIAE
jgi:hypothetical protein